MSALFMHRSSIVEMLLLKNDKISAITWKLVNGFFPNPLHFHSCAVMAMMVMIHFGLFWKKSVCLFFLFMHLRICLFFRSVSSLQTQNVVDPVMQYEILLQYSYIIHRLFLKIMYVHLDTSRLPIPCALYKNEPFLLISQHYRRYLQYQAFFTKP